MKNINFVVMFIVVTTIVSGCLLTPISDKRIARYRPQVSDRASFIGIQPASVAVNNAVTGVPATNAMIRMLNRGDRVIVELRGIPVPEAIRGEVDDLGLNLPLIGRVRIDGKNTFEAEKLIEKTYIDGGYYTKINVMVGKQDDEYFVTGEVNKQDKYLMTGDRTLLQAITSAGGYTDFAKKSKVKVMRGQGKDKQILFFDCERIEKGKEKDPLIKPGDIIEVPRRIFL
ncbi:MAG: SLBB domain-containing protein [Kiritimatiellae bacterium]|nr:SLBB domain-containing protein [Kiritimatiellia bacterium]MDD5520916.1 SLBB domain-containing protein [Kiritimatiellia bacterium]